MITICLTIYLVLAATFIFSLAFAAARPVPQPDYADQLIQLMLRTELRSKPSVWQMDTAA